MIMVWNVKGLRLHQPYFPYGGGGDDDDDDDNGDNRPLFLEL